MLLTTVCTGEDANAIRWKVPILDRSQIFDSFVDEIEVDFMPLLGSCKGKLVDEGRAMVSRWQGKQHSHFPLHTKSTKKSAK